MKATAPVAASGSARKAVRSILDTTRDGAAALRATAGSRLRAVFTGIVRELGRVAARTGGESGVRLTVEAPATAAGAALGDSVAVNGVCLTVVSAADGTLAF